MKKFTVRVQPIKRGIRTYYEPQVHKKFLGIIPYWAPIFVDKTDGTYTTIIRNIADKEYAYKHIERLKYIYGEENVNIVGNFDLNKMYT